MTIETLTPNSPGGILDAIEAWLSRFVAYPSDHARRAHVLWIAHAHLIEAFENTPRMAFLSPEPGSGKSRALEVTEPLVPRPVITVNSTPAYVFRKISDDAGLPTLLFDEVDAVFGSGKSDANEDLRGLLNSGYRRGATAGRAAVRGREIITEDWPSFSAVAMAGLHQLPDTLTTRSVIVNMKRRKPTEVIQPYRRRVYREEGEQLFATIAAWAASVTGTVTASWPELPEGIEDRDADIWEPLIAVADAAGGAWPELARDAAIHLVAEAHNKPATLGIKLLTDIHKILGDRDRIRTTDLLGELHEIEESPWGSFRGEPIDGRFLAKTLGRYGIPSAHPVRFPEGVAKGFTRADFSDSFERYVPKDKAPTVTPVTDVTQSQHEREGRSA